jgi:hypothetical protein
MTLHRIAPEPTLAESDESLAEGDTNPTHRPGTARFRSPCPVLAWLADLAKLPARRLSPAVVAT